MYFILECYIIYRKRIRRKCEENIILAFFSKTTFLSIEQSEYTKKAAIDNPARRSIQIPFQFSI
jgi:hypothetical protein